MLEVVLGLSLLNQDMDKDKDGLWDVWETEGYGPIDPKVHGTNPNRADVFILFRPRRGVTDAKLKPTIDRIVKFYSELDYTNPDGSKGLHAIPIVLPRLPEEHDKTDYKSLYNEYMPKEWRGLAHGVLVEVSTGGGGQANRPDWCGSSNRWHTIVHELGHQFGLGHNPKGGGTGSPFFTSLMNYDYSYSFNGSGNAVHYSQGKLSDLKMKETDLNENIPHSAETMQFLSKRPYYFKVKEVDESSCMVDWNRNGIFGEEHVKADVNDGYSLGLRGNKTLSLAAGGPALVSHRENLLVITPTLKDAKEYESRIWGLSDDRAGGLAIRVYQGTEEKSYTQFLDGIQPVTGEISATSNGDMIQVIASTKNGYQLIEFSIKEGKPVLNNRSSWITGPGAAVVCASPSGTKIFRWNSITKQVFVRDWDADNERLIQGALSHVGVSAAWNSNKAQYALTEVVDQGSKKGRIRIAHLDSDWSVKDRIWVEGEKGNAATSSRPVLLFDGNNRGPNGGYNVYVKGRTNKPNERKIAYVCRQIEDPSLAEGWRVKMVGNEWAHGMNTPAATFYNGDIAYAYRLGFGNNIQKISLSFQASGIEDRWLVDFDEVSHVFETGLQNSLFRVQKEVGIRK